jgi:hypothetical protein
VTPPEYWEPVEPDIPAMRSRVRELAGNPADIDPDESFEIDPDELFEEEPPRPATILELDRYEEITGLGVIEPPPRRQALRSVRYEHLMAVKWLDRFGYMTTEQLRRAVLPDATLRATQDLLRRMRDAGHVERRRTQLSIEDGRERGGSAPRLHSLTAAGHRLGKQSPGLYGSVIPPSNRWRASEASTSMHLLHNLHTIAWWQAFEAALAPGVGVTEVLTPRYDEGRLRPPTIEIARGRGWRAIERRDVWLGEQHAFAGIPDGPYVEVVKPDLTIRLDVLGWLVGQRSDIRFDLLIEVDRTQKASKNRRKFKRYDAFLTCWGLHHPRVQELETRPVVIFTSPDDQSMRALMKAADEEMTGRIGRTGDPEHAWYYPGRDHILFTIEDEIHHGSMLAWRLPKLPPALREALGYESFLTPAVMILPLELTAGG